MLATKPIALQWKQTHKHARTHPRTHPRTHTRTHTLTHQTTTQKKRKCITNKPIKIKVADTRTSPAPHSPRLHAWASPKLKTTLWRHSITRTLLPVPFPPARHYPGPTWLGRNTYVNWRDLTRAKRGHVTLTGDVQKGTPSLSPWWHKCGLHHPLSPDSGRPRRRSFAGLRIQNLVARVVGPPLAEAQSDPNLTALGYSAGDTMPNVRVQQILQGVLSLETFNFYFKHYLV